MARYDRNTLVNVWDDDERFPNSIGVTLESCYPDGEFGEAIDDLEAHGEHREGGGAATEKTIRPATLDDLMQIYQRYLKATGLPVLSADELYIELLERLSASPHDIVLGAQADWVREFRDGWERIERADLAQKLADERRQS